MTVKVTRTRTRQSENINFTPAMDEELNQKFQDFDNQMIKDGKIISITNDTSEDFLTITSTFTFPDAKSALEYFILAREDIDFSKLDHDCLVYFLDNNITHSWSFDF